MAQPSEYIRLHSFTTFQAANPSDPLPSNWLENELNAVKTVLDQVRANLALIQRDDGELANLSVGAEQLAVSLLAGINPPTLWTVAPTAYAANDSVVYIDAGRSELWRVDTAHTSSTDFDADAAAYMTQLADFAAVLQSAGAVTYDDTGRTYTTGATAQEAIDGADTQLLAVDTRLDGIARTTYRHFGTGATGINAAMTAVGSGEVVVPEDVTISAMLSVPSNVTLVIPYGVTVTLDTPLAIAISLGTDRDRPGLRLEGTLALNGNATFGVWGEGCLYPRISGGGEITGWKHGVFLKSSVTRALTWPWVRGIRLGVPHTEGVVYPFRISCEPSTGADMVDGCDIDGVVVEDATPGAYSAANEHTADQVSIQGVIGGWISNVVSRNGGENGMTVEFGSRGIDISNCILSGADGHGLAVTGVNYRIDVTGVSGTALAVGQTITDSAGATADIQFVVGDVVWLENPSTAKMVAGAFTTDAGGSGTISIVHNVRDVRVRDGVQTYGNGLDAATSGSTLAGLYIQHADDILLGGTHTGNRTHGVLLDQSTYRTAPGFSAPEDATQTTSVGGTGGSTAKGSLVLVGDGDTTRMWFDDNGRIRMGEALLPAPASQSSAAATNYGWTLNSIDVMEAVANAAAPLKLNRTGSTSGALGAVSEVYKNGTLVGYLGTDGVKLAGFTSATKPAAGVAGRLNFRTDTGALELDDGSAYEVIGWNSLAETATTSGTSHLVTGIPDWATEISIVLNRVSLNDTGNLLLRIGAGGSEATGYSSVCGSASATGTEETTGFALSDSSVAADLWIGEYTLRKIGSIWSGSGVLGPKAGQPRFAFGDKTLVGDLDRVLLTSTTGGTFDGGSFIVRYRR